jgi:hypothetical protein
MDETDARDGHWWTYAQLAQARQIGKRAAVRLAQRHRLQRQPGNDGQTRVWVPTDMASSSPHRPTPPATDANDTSPDVAPPFHAQALSALEAALADAGRRVDEASGRADAALALADRTLAQLADASTRADEANKRADAAEARSEANVQRADRAEARAEQERLAADRFRTEAEEARGEAEAARATAQEAQNVAEAERHRIAGELAQAVERRAAAEERAHHVALELTAEKAMRSAADDEVERLRQAENKRLQLGRWRRAWRGWRGR